MTEGLYERYKEALRLGHVAALRGQVDAALAAYAEASVLAPDRPLPHASRGAVLARSGRHDAAIEAFDAALAIAPRDDVGLAGRAESLARLGRRVAAAEAYDRLASVHEAAGRIADACDDARRALEQAESKDRRRLVEALTSRLRAAPADDATADALTRALRVLDGSTTALPSGAAPGGDEAAVAETTAGTVDDPTAAAAAQQTEDASDPAELRRQADAAAAAGDPARAGALLTATARIEAAAGRYASALDACQDALALTPADPDVHLTLAAIYLDRGWRPLAGDTLLLVSRLVALTGDAGARDRLCTIVADRLPDDPRLIAACR